MSKNGLGERVKKYRELRGWTQKTLAENSGVSLRTIKYIEQQGKEPTLRIARRIAKALDISIIALIER